MITIKDKATITKENHQLIIDVGSEVPEGEYELEIVLNKIKRDKKPFTFRTSEANINAASTFGRQELYDDDGR